MSHYGSEAEFIENTPSSGKPQACALPRLKPVGSCRCTIGHQNRLERHEGLTLMFVLLGIIALTLVALWS